MIVDFHKNYDKQFERLSEKIQGKVEEAIERFMKNPHDPALKNHALKGAMKDKRAISVTGNVRIIFREFDSYTLVLMLDVGSHPHVYGN